MFAGEKRVYSEIQSCILRSLGTEVAKDMPLMMTGMDSLSATEIQRALGAALRVALPATLVFDYPSIQGIVSMMLCQ